VAWLFGIARNVVAGERRRNAKELRMAARIRGRELVDEDDLAVLHERIDRESAARELFRDLTRLPAGERAVLELVALDGLSAGEAAQALGIGTVAAACGCTVPAAGCGAGSISPPPSARANRR
jgi:DNA-directed RNA polymerase specialized sigma24 family protein